ncbi:MAG: helix-turn-helix transcriptional regulator [Hyphomicrobiales bacterium]|nr:helix-turn-helix transcriptional regulator [Hyphomicrobiales bacterium]
MALKRRRNRVPQPPCPLSECMALLGGAWTPHVIWYLADGPRRFSELRSDIPRVSAKMLTRRLRDLEALGIVTRNVVPSSPPSVEYALSAMGREFLPVIRAIVEMGFRLKARREENAGETGGSGPLSPRGAASPGRGESPPAG